MWFRVADPQQEEDPMKVAMKSIRVSATWTPPVFTRSLSARFRRHGSEVRQTSGSALHHTPPPSVVSTEKMSSVTTQPQRSPPSHPSWISQTVDLCRMMKYNPTENLTAQLTWMFSNTNFFVSFFPFLLTVASRENWGPEVIRCLQQHYPTSMSQKQLCTSLLAAASTNSVESAVALLSLSVQIPMEETTPVAMSEESISWASESATVSFRTETNESSSSLSPTETSRRKKNSTLGLALIEALRCGSQEVIECLFQRQSDLPACTDDDGRTALHWSCLVDDVGTLRRLLSQRQLQRAINAQDQSQCSALWYAVREGSTECVQILLGHGADVTLTDDLGVSCFDVALQRGDHVTYRCLALRVQGASLAINPSMGVSTSPPPLMAHSPSSQQSTGSSSSSSSSSSRTTPSSTPLAVSQQREQEREFKRQLRWSERTERSKPVHQARWWQSLNHELSITNVLLERAAKSASDEKAASAQGKSNTNSRRRSSGVASRRSSVLRCEGGATAFTATHHESYPVQFYAPSNSSVFPSNTNDFSSPWQCSQTFYSNSNNPALSVPTAASLPSGTFVSSRATSISHNQLATTSVPTRTQDLDAIVASANIDDLDDFTF